MTQRILGPTGSPRRRRLLLFPALLTAIAALLFIGGAASAPTSAGVQNNGLFQLDGNTLPAACPSTFPGTTAGSGDDWANLYTDRFLAGTKHNPPCHSDAFAFVADGTGAGTPPDHSFWSQGGSKDAYDPALGPWQWKPNDVSPDKNDIVDAFAALYHTGSVATSDLKRFIYFGSDRFDVSGDAQQGFQFLQSATCLAGTVGGVAPNSDAACPAGTPSTPNTTCTPAFTTANAGYFVDPSTGCPAHHKDGDLLVLVNFNNGGVLGLAGVYEWWGANGAGAGCYGTPPTTGPPATAGICDQPVLTGGGANCATATGDKDFCSTANTTDLANEPVWSYARKGGGSSYQTSAFIEGGLNLAKIPGAGQCFPTFVAETRSSGGPSSGLSLQAQLKDLAMGRFQLCGATISISPNGVNGVGSNHVFTVTVSKTVAGSLTPVAGAHPVVTLKRSDNSTLTPSGNTCSTTGTNASGQCTVTFTSSTADVVTGHAAADVLIDGSTFHVETDGTAPNSGDAVKRFVDANVSVTPNGVNAVGSTHTFNVSTTAIPSGTTASLTSITPSVDVGSIIAATNTCATPAQWGGSGNTRTCSFQVTSSTATVIVANAQSVWHFVDNDANANPASVDVTRSTDSTHGSSGSVTKRFVDANISVTPNGVNAVGSTHTFNVSTTAVPSGTTASLTSITPSVDVGSIIAATNTCVDSTKWGGSGNTRTCSFQVTSSTARVIVATAQSVWHFVDNDANANPASVNVTRSTDSTHGSSGSVTKRFVDANVSITPNGVNEVNHAHMFNVSTTGIPSGTDATLLSIVPSVSPSTTLLNNTCATSADWGGTGTTRTCHFEINSSTPGVFTANATVVWRFNDNDDGANPASVDVTRSTDSTHGSSGPATKRFVDAYITIGPPLATNNVGQPHTFVVNVFQDDGFPAGAPGDAVTGFGPAPNGTSVTVTLTNTLGANWQFVAPGDTCSFIAGIPPSGGLINGQCGVTFSSATAGTVTGHAAVTFSVGGQSLHRETDGNAPNSGNAVKNFVAGSLIWHKVDNGNRPQGGATFDLCQTHTYNLTSNLMELLPDPPGPICRSVVDKTPLNAVGYDGLDEDGTAGNFKVSGLQLGRYSVHETVAPDGFEPDLSTKSKDLVPGAKDGEITSAFVNRRPVLKIAGFGYTNTAVDAASQPDGIVKGSTTYTVTLHNYGNATATLSNSTLIVTGDANCGASKTLNLTGTVAVNADSAPFQLTCTYDHPNPAKITADLVVKYTTNNLERTASGSPAQIFFTVNPN